MHGRAIPFLPVLLLLPAGLAVAVAPPTPAPPSKRVVIGPNVFLEIQGKARRVVVPSSVCLRKGRVEGLVTRAAKGRTRAQEYLVAADIDARHLHAALVLTSAQKGTPVRYLPKFVAPSGTPFLISLRYQQG